MTRLRARLAQEQGWGLVSSILVLGILISMSLPLLSLVDGQQQQSAHERKSESSFNLAEAAFDAGLFVLSGAWPTRSDDAYPSACTAESTELKCPNAEILASSYSGPDYSARGWTVSFRDDVNKSEFYDQASVNGPNGATYDANGNAKMWIRADARAANGNRTVLALVRRQDQIEPFPRNAVTAGWFGISTGGHKVIVDTNGTGDYVTAQPAPIAVRCTAATAPPSPRCLDYRADRGQVSPDVAYTGYEGATAVTEEVLDRFEERAVELDSYHPSGCPRSPEGALVFIESGNCHYAGGGSVNSPSSPGMLIVKHGSVSFGGSMKFYGLVYAANRLGSTGAVVTIGGSAKVFGSVAVDGGGGFTAGSNGENLVFDDRVFPLLKTFGSAATVQGTWRELPAS